MLLIEGARTVDLQYGVSRQEDWVVLDSGLLARPAETRAVAGSEGCERIAAADLFLMPGLIDAHVHLGRPQPPSAAKDHTSTSAHVARAAGQTIRAGVTLVRDMGDRWPRGLAVAELAKGLSAPGVVSALGGLTAPNGYGAFLGEAVRGLDELLAAVQRRHEAGARLIKLFLTGGVDFTTGSLGPPQFDARTVKLVATRAHELGLPLSVHANGAEAVLTAVLAGADSIEHGILVSDDGLRAMADHDACWVPTLTPLWRAPRGGGATGNNMGDATIASLARILARHQESVARALDLGVRVVTGTDAGSPSVAHGSLVDEVELFLAAGADPATALRSATVRAAECLGVGQETGAIEPGRRADLLLLRRDPLESVAAVREIAFVICGGRITALDPQRPGSR